MEPIALATFFRELGWRVSAGDRVTVVSTQGGAFGLEHDEAPPRLELALSVPEALLVDELAEMVEPAGGILMEPPQETAWGGWGFSFNDPEGNTWEIGSPYTVTAIDRLLTTGARPMSGPIVALAVPRRRLPETA